MEPVQIKINILRLFGIDVDTGNGVLDAVTAIGLVAVIFIGLILYRRFSALRKRNAEPNPQNQTRPLPFSN
jgi:hypothetical protein